MSIFKDIREVIFRNKVASIFFLINIFIFGSGILILSDHVGPTSKYDKKFFSINENLYNNNGGVIGSYDINGMYQSKGVISTNKEVEFYIFELTYHLQRDYFNGFRGGDNISVPDNINVGICPSEAGASGNLGKKSPCIDVILKKSDDGSIVTFWNQTYENKNNIEFLSSGQKGLTVSSLLPQIHKEKVFEIEPYNTYLQIQLQKYMYVLALLGFIVILFQIYDFGIKYLKK